jgi:hypothetical protein
MIKATIQIRARPVVRREEESGHTWPAAEISVRVAGGERLWATVPRDEARQAIAQMVRSALRSAL